MHADIHLTLHHLADAERELSAVPVAAPAAAVAPPLRVQLGWRVVEFGLRLALPEGHRATASRAAHAVAA
ncbi:hypothetical protein KV205_30815 [Streptomyces sp. SKN60]|uniref:hypothetical protein n=1 Tax=Streptomyces sp. SKN60 TaxID=2855506 RepID=UPI002247910B|nr:hypothetical protein [Streptomyces sp. SKN60]MCX2184887.1 hypothetical protein [Streptomyces sp. SKN60]